MQKQDFVWVLLGLIMLGSIVVLWNRPLLSGGMGTYDLETTIYGTETVRYPNVTFEEIVFPVAFSHLVINATYRVSQVIMGDPINEMELEWNVVFTSSNFSRIDFTPYEKVFFFQFRDPGFIILEKVNPFNHNWEERITVSVF